MQSPTTSLKRTPEFTSPYEQWISKKAKTDIDLWMDFLYSSDSMSFDVIMSFVPAMKKIGRYSSFIKVPGMLGVNVTIPNQLFTLSKDEQEWEIVKIFGHRIYRGGDCDFMVYWAPVNPSLDIFEDLYTPIDLVNLDPSLASVEPLRNLYEFVPEMLLEYRLEVEEVDEVEWVDPSFADDFSWESVDNDLFV